MRRMGAALLLTLTMGGVALGDVVETYAKRCASCHGKDGKGKTKMGEKLKIKDLSDPAVQAAFTDEQALKDLSDGVKDKDTGKDRMPAFKDKVSADDLKKLVEYSRTFAPKK